MSLSLLVKFQHVAHNLQYKFSNNRQKSQRSKAMNKVEKRGAPPGTNRGGGAKKKEAHLLLTSKSFTLRQDQIIYLKSAKLGSAYVRSLIDADTKKQLKK